MNTVNSLFGVEDAFELLASGKTHEFSKAQSPVDYVIASKVPEKFSLKEVVTAVASFLKGIVSRFVKIEVCNLCGDDVPVSGNKSQLQVMLKNAVTVVEKSLQGFPGVINVIIHDLKRTADAVLLPKGDQYEKSSALEKEEIESTVRGKYVAISVRKAMESSVRTKATPSKDEKEEISYCDTGVIVKKASSDVIIYLTRFAG